MASEIRSRGNTFNLAFTFLDENGDVAFADTAQVELTYPGRHWFETETLDLTQDGDQWKTTWDSTKSRGGWVRFHADARTSGDDPTVYAEDGRFKITANMANYQHEPLPGGSLNDYPWR